MVRLLLLSFLFTQIAFSQLQHDGLLIHRKISAFGEVENWISRVDTFFVTNQSDEVIYILKQKFPREFEVRIPTRGIPAGETSVIEVIYKPKKIGKFNDKIQLYHSQSKKPFELLFKGEVISFDPYHEIACPSFSTSNFQRRTFNMDILVIDSVTKDPIPKALLEIHKSENFKQYYTNKNGLFTQSSNYGLYHIYTEANGYHNKVISHYFNPKQNQITITLVPKKEKVAIQEGKQKITLIDSIKLLPIKTDIDKQFAEIDTNFDTLPIYEPGKDVDFNLEDYKTNNLVFLIDISGSMRFKDRLPLLKASMIELVNMLRPEDKITIMTYADDVEVIIRGVSGANKKEMIDVIKNLKASGSTFGDKAVKRAYEVAKKEFIKGGNNQILLASDGGFNGLGKSEWRLHWLIKKQVQKGINFSVLAYGKNKFGKEFLEELSENGQGAYLYIRTLEQALVELNYTIMQQAWKN